MKTDHQTHNENYRLEFFYYIAITTGVPFKKSKFQSHSSYLREERYFAYKAYIVKKDA